MNDFFSITDKLMKLKGFRKPGQLIEWLEVNKSTFYTWRRRKKYSFEGIISFSQRKKISLHWLFWDEGPPMRECLNNEHHLITDREISEVLKILKGRDNKE